MRKRGCFKCHAVDRTKVGPAYREVAAKYRGIPDADERLRLHLTTAPRIRIEGHEEEHVSLAGIPDADLRAVVSWILSR
ncbi:MAG: c-type cytochrome [Burkholderiales bacterium]|nr:c-type cytochrome [Burkholderiales bacterium]